MDDASPTYSVIRDGLLLGLPHYPENNCSQRTRVEPGNMIWSSRQHLFVYPLRFLITGVYWRVPFAP